MVYLWINRDSNAWKRYDSWQSNHWSLRKLVNTDIYIYKYIIYPLNNYIHIYIYIYKSGWWFETFCIFHFIYGIILPIDELIFFKIVIAPPTRIYLVTFKVIPYLFQPNPHKKDILKWAHCYLQELLRIWTASSSTRWAAPRAPHARPGVLNRPLGNHTAAMGNPSRGWSLRKSSMEKKSHCHGWLPEANHLITCGKRCLGPFSTLIFWLVVSKVLQNNANQWVVIPMFFF